MASATPVRTDQTGLNGTLREAVAQEVITADQARQILALERGETSGAGGPAGPAARPVPRPAARLRPLVAEAVGYVGGALAVVAALILAQEFWAELEPWARVGLLGVAAVALGGAGAVARAEEGPVDRLRGFLWVLSVIAVGGAVGVGLTEYTQLAGDEVALAVGAAAGVCGAGLWRLRVAGLQQLMVLVGAVTAVVAGLSVLDVALGEWIGLAVWALGLAWALLAWSGWIRPVQVGIVAGTAVAVLAPSMAGEGVGWVLVLGLVTAGGLIAASVPLRQMLLLGLGVLGIVLYVPRIVFEYFGDTLGAPVSLLVTGIALVAVALSAARVRAAGDGGDDQAAH